MLWKRENCIVIANGYGVPFWDDENVLKLDSGNVCTTLNIQEKNPTELYT